MIRRSRRSPTSSAHGRSAFGHAAVVARVFAPLVIGILGFACSAVQQPKAPPFYAETPPPPAAELRWSNGKAPKSLDPALAAAAPETDIVRAIFEGLTEIDPKTLEARPAAAEKWEANANFTTWKFHLRADAKWSNGRPVTAGDFVRAWRRLWELGDKTAHRELLANIRARTGGPKASDPGGETKNSATPISEPDILNEQPDQPMDDRRDVAPQASPESTKKPAADEFGFKAEDDRTFTVSLVRPDPDLPKLLAHPIFRPIYGKAFREWPDSLVTNGPFRIAPRAPDGLTLVRSETYWNAGMIGLDRVRFVPTETAEAALDAYRRGDLDAVTNVEFSPLLLKLLEPYSDFRRNTHAALNYYEVNYRKYPFDDRRVREALAGAIERERLTESELAGSTQPALQFLPFTAKSVESVVQDPKHAAELLADAGFAGGANFPPVRLVVNRNDVQLRIARSVARMWKQNLNIDTEIIVKEAGEIEEIGKAGDFDLIRRGVVLPTVDELASLSSIVDEGISPEKPSENFDPRSGEPDRVDREPRTNASETPPPVLTQDEELFRLYAIPLYFPTSYALVKPYVVGFEMGGLDAPVLTDVRIDNAWQPKKAASESN